MAAVEPTAIFKAPSQRRHRECGKLLAAIRACARVLIYILIAGCVDCNASGGGAKSRARAFIS